MSDINEIIREPIEQAGKRKINSIVALLVASCTSPSGAGLYPVARRY